MYWVRIKDLAINLDKITSITKDKHSDKYRINFWADACEFPYIVEFEDEKVRNKAFVEILYKITKWERSFDNEP